MQICPSEKQEIVQTFILLLHDVPFPSCKTNVEMAKTMQNYADFK